MYLMFACLCNNKTYIDLMLNHRNLILLFEFIGNTML